MHFFFLLGDCQIGAGSPFYVRGRRWKADVISRLGIEAGTMGDMGFGDRRRGQLNPSLILPVAIPNFQKSCFVKTFFVQITCINSLICISGLRLYTQFFFLLFHTLSSSLSTIHLHVAWLNHSGLYLSKKSRTRKEFSQT